MIMPLSTIKVPLAAKRVKRVIEAEHFRVDRVIGHYQEIVAKISNYSINYRKQVQANDVKTLYWYLAWQGTI